jgi:hypothetical protein
MNMIKFVVMQSLALSGILLMLKNIAEKLNF